MLANEFSNLKVAIVTDWMLAPGGADRVLISLTRLFNDCTIFTAVYDESKYIDSFKIKHPVKATFLQKIPFIFDLYRHLNFLAPMAFENLDLRGYDLIITLSAGPAKGVIAGLDQKHLSIIFTPPRAIWERVDNNRSSFFAPIYRFISTFSSHWLRAWDYTAALRADKVISISNFIQSKVKKYYRIKSEVIYPGIDSFWFEKNKASQTEEPFYLVVSRLYDYKRVDMAIRACVASNKRLLIVGSGPNEKYLKEVAGESDIIAFLGNLSDAEIKSLYSKANALLFCGIEDFGLVPVEAMANGLPVFAFNYGGVTEIVEPGISGELFGNEYELTKLLAEERYKIYDKQKIKQIVQRFSEKMFHENIISQVKDLYEG